MEVVVAVAVAVAVEAPAPAVVVVPAVAAAAEYLRVGHQSSFDRYRPEDGRDDVGVFCGRSPEKEVVLRHDPGCDVHL